MSAILVFVTLSAPLAIFFIRKSLLLLAFQLFGALALAGTVLAVIDRIHGLIRVDTAQLVVSLSFLVIFFILLFFGKVSGKSWNIGDFPLVLVSISIASILVISRVQASGVTAKLFSGAGRLAVAEDNAKWLNLSSNIAQNHLLNLNDGTSGGLAALILISSAVVTLFSEAIFGGLNIPGITIQSILLSHNVLLVLAPLSLAPVVHSIWYKPSNTVSKLAKFLLLCGIGVAGTFAVFATAAPMAFGHLSFEFILVSLVFWAAYVVHNKIDSKYLVLITFIGSSVALVWLPLPNFAIAVAITGLAIWAFFSRPIRQIRWFLNGLLLAFNLAISVWLAAPMLQYLAQTTTPQASNPSSGTSSTSSIDLVVAEGGAMAAGKIEYLLIAISITSLVIAIVITPKSKRLTKALSAYPILFLLGYATAVAGYDYIVASDGWPHYGTRKLVFGFVAVSIAVLLPIVFFVVLRLVSKRQWLLAVVVLLIAGTVFSSGSFRRSSFLFNNGVWSSFDTRIPTPGVGPLTWIDLANPTNEPQSLSNYPILCVETNQQGIIVGVTDQYFCSRFLVSMHGLESTGNILLIPMLTSPVSDETITNIASLSGEIGQSPILEIDQVGTIKGTLTLSQYVELIQYSNAQYSRSK